MNSTLPSESRANEWNSSYERRENFVFWPADEVVRFVSRYLRKRVDLDTVIDILPGSKNAKVLDLGCGIGRNLAFGKAMGLEMYGIELSSVAVEKARTWLPSLASDERIVLGDVRKLPWQDAFFDHALSDSVLDSMPFEFSSSGIQETARVLKPGGLFYCNLIAEKTSSGLFVGEKVQKGHESGTIQSYFDRNQIESLFNHSFEFLRFELHCIEDASRQPSRCRWHLVLKRK